MTHREYRCVDEYDALRLAKDIVKLISNTQTDIPLLPSELIRLQRKAQAIANWAKRAQPADACLKTPG